MTVYLTQKDFVCCKGQRKWVDTESLYGIALKDELLPSNKYLRLTLIDRKKRAVIKQNCVLDLIVIRVNKIYIKLLRWDSLTEILSNIDGTSSTRSRSKSFSKVYESEWIGIYFDPFSRITEGEFRSAPICLIDFRTIRTWLRSLEPRRCRS